MKPSRPCDNKICIFCDIKINGSAIGVTVPSKRLNKLSNKIKDKMLLKWTHETVNYLHISCWKKMKKMKKMKTEENLIQSIENTMEKYDSKKIIIRKIKKIIQLLKNSKKTICFTGAGLSASAGLYTYRGTDGVDTLNEYSDEQDDDEPDWSEIQPTMAHNIITKMHNVGFINYIITQNCDNLHQKSGIHKDFITDLHGNLFKEYCENCNREYTRDFVTDSSDIESKLDHPFYKKCRNCKWNHYTGRNCDDCDGRLRDTMVHFGDELHNNVCGGFLKAKTKAKHSDLCICFGSSCSIFPSSSLALKSKKTVIVNLQDTDIEENCFIHVYCTTDEFAYYLMDIIDE